VAKAQTAKEPAPGPARVGIGGPVGSGKTALIEALLPKLKERGTEVAVVTNDLVTEEDAQRLKLGGLIAPERVVGVETGACPHTVIREDPTLNIEAAERLEAAFPKLDLIIIESGGDNLASTFSLDLVDYWLFVIDVADGDDIPRKRGPGIVQADLLVINKIDLAPYVEADLAAMARDAEASRKGKAIVFTNCRTGEGLDRVIAHLAHDVLLEP
jgi:urease accessory protein